MNIARIETNLQKLIKSFDKETFIYDLLLAYGLPKASVTRLRKGNLNLSKVDEEISWKKKLLFREEFEEDLYSSISALVKRVNHGQRFVVVTDYERLLAVDTKTEDKLDIDIRDLPRHYDFFLPWAGMEKAQYINENPADVKAAERMARLFDEIKKDNPEDSPEAIHALNVFLSRLLFCFFAEDTDIFEGNQFTNAVASHTQTDGSDLNIYLDTLFEVLNTPENDRPDLPSYLHEFPYVNGGLFKEKLSAPVFTRHSRQAIVDSGELDWAAINPDIFGSMIQAVISPEHRGGLGMHYTSVPNIMKVIEPLFLNELYEAFEKAKGNPKKLKELLDRLGKLKIFDPACGSGNFLIIAYKELRRLEIRIIQHLQDLKAAVSGSDDKTVFLSLIPKSQLDRAASYQVELFSRIQLNQFYGIELDDFAHEIAQLSLWLAEHQMNVEFKKEFEQTNPTLPLKEAGRIVCGNACRLDWEEICPKKEGDEIYILGNPPYLGARLQSKEQKADMNYVFNGFKGLNNLDYIACWFKKGTDYIAGSNAQFAFVTTNSISQGEQVSILWPYILEKGASIFFAHSSFKWTNNAKGNAGVTVAIIGVSFSNDRNKTLFRNGISNRVNSINPYLVKGSNVFIHNRMNPISYLPNINFGSMANDGGSLLLSPAERNKIIDSNPNAEKFIRKLVGALEFIRGVDKYCIWIEDKDIDEAKSILLINERIEQTKSNRLKSKRAATNRLAVVPHRFAEVRYKESNSIIIPSVSSEKREYIPMGFLDARYIIVAPNFAMYDAEPWHLGLLTSRMHMVWVRTVAGRLKTDYRYSSSLVYNTFPFPPISDQRKQEITQCVFRILGERERHPEKTLAELYDPAKMPAGLREAHRANDEVIERCYRARPFESDEERLEYLFRLYEKMIGEEDQN